MPGRATAERRRPLKAGITEEEARRKRQERVVEERKKKRQEELARRRSKLPEQQEQQDVKMPPAEDVAGADLSPAERGLEAAAKIRELASQAKTMDDLEASFPFLKFEYGMESIGFAGNPPQTPVSVRFKINPQFEVQLTGGHAVEMRAEGTGSGAAQTRVQWKPGTLTLKDPTAAQPNKGPYTVGREMVAEPLSQDHPTGSRASADTDQSGWMELLPAAGRRTHTGSGSGPYYYIRGHLLNDNIGGIANEANLFPITHEANGQHKNFAEEFIKKGIDKGFVYSYRVEVKDKGLGYDAAVPKKGAIAAGAYTVDADLHFQFGRLDTAGKIIPNTAHKGIIESRYGSTGTEPFGGDKATEFTHDFPGGKPSAATAVGGELTHTASHPKPAMSNTGLTSTFTGPSSGFSVPPVVSSLAPSVSGQKIAPSATLVPKGDKLSLRKSTKVNVVNYFTQLVQGWTPTDVDAWYTAVTGNSLAKWQDVEQEAVTNHLDAPLAATIFQPGSVHLTRVSINGAAVNT